MRKKQKMPILFSLFKTNFFWLGFYKNFELKVKTQRQFDET